MEDKRNQLDPRAQVDDAARGDAGWSTPDVGTTASPGTSHDGQLNQLGLPGGMLGGLKFRR